MPALMALLCIVASCDLLKPRDPQPPNSENNANPPATSPDILVQNLQSAFAKKNVNEYQKIFSDTSSDGRQFIFVPTQKAAGNYAAFFLHWTSESELSYFRKAMASISNSSVPVVLFTNTVQTAIVPDSVLYSADYSVFLSPTTYSGRARFFIYLLKNKGEWAMYRWEDLPSAKDTTQTWSDLKGQFSQ